MNSVERMNLLHLPDHVLEKIFSYISYDAVSRCRIVCKRFDFISKQVLNKGFKKVERYHARCLRKMKAQLPRRESERRKHPLARHCDVLTAVETRLSLLGMTYHKFIELESSCFIPGRVIDETYKVLRAVAVEQFTFLRAHEVLQELRDLSSMAMEHFDEKIAPEIKKRKEASRPNFAMNAAINDQFKPSTSRHGNSELSRHKLKEEVKAIVKTESANRKEMNLLKQKLAEVLKYTGDLEKKVLKLQNLLSTHLEKVKEQDLRIDVVNRRVGTEKEHSSTPNGKTTNVSCKSKNALISEDNELANAETNNCSSTPKRRSQRLQVEKARKRFKK